MKARPIVRMGVAAMASVLAAGCTVLAPVPTGQALIGQPASAVEARFGKPPEQYPRAGGEHAGCIRPNPMGSSPTPRISTPRGAWCHSGRS